MLELLLVFILILVIISFLPLDEKAKNIAYIVLLVATVFLLLRGGI